MIRHYLTLEHIARALHARLSGSQVLEIFSQEKHVLTLCFLLDAEEIVITASVDATYGTILERTNVHRARRNTLDHFPMLIGQQCRAVTKHPADRIISFVFERHSMHVQLFGAGKGNIIVTEGTAICDALMDSKQLCGSLLRHPEQSAAPLGQHYTAESHFRSDVVEACRASNAYYALDRDQEALFSLIPLHGWNIIETYTDVFAALRRVISLRRAASRLVTLQRQVSTILRREIQRVSRSLEGMRGDVAAYDRATQYRHLADLLMSLPPTTTSGSDTIEVSDWDGTTVSIRIDAEHSMIDNATRYYQKAKQAETALEERLLRIPMFEKRLSTLQHDLLQAETTADMATLERLHDTYARRMTDHSQTPQYKTFHLSGSYTLYVGRNAANNDELTMRFAKQNDWWLHARGVSGSHAVLRGGGNERPPKEILEQAAAIAAYYSQARNASYTPVIYTQRKNVRKPKGANVGAVVVDREQVIMVKPGLPDES